MPLSIVIEHAQGETIEDFTISDVTGSYDALNNAGGYGSPNAARGEVANFLLVSSNDKNGTRTYLSVANTTPLSTLLWSLLSAVDGWHQATLLSINPYSNVQSYVVNDVQYYAPTGKVYFASNANSAVAPDAPTGSQYWTEATDLTLLQQNHTNLTVVDYNFLIESRTDTKILDELYDLIKEDFACKLDISDAAHPINLIAMLEGAQSKMIDDKPDQAQEIMTAIADCQD